MIIQPMPLLDHKMITSYKVQDGGKSHPWGLGFIIAESGHQQGLPLVAIGYYPIAPRHVVSTELEQEENGWMYRLEDQNIHLAARQEDIFSYNINFNNVLVDMFARLNPTMEPAQFPVVPTLPVFPLSDQEDENDDEVDHHD